MHSGENNFYSYVNNPNGWLDTFGLSTGASYNKDKGQGVYILRDPLTQKIKYVGRGDVHARKRAHANSEDKGHLVQEVLHDNNLTKAEAKHIEQKLMDKYGGPKSVNKDTQLLNNNRSYSDTNPNAPSYDIAGKSKEHASNLMEQTISKIN